MRRSTRFFAIAIAVSLIGSTAVAQETTDEREAARDVLGRMATLEGSLNIPAIVSAVSGPDAKRDAVAARAKALMNSEFLALSDDICTHPEIGFQEHRSVARLAAALRAHNFDVTTGVAGLETAFVAHYKQNNGAPQLGVIVEYDALRGTSGPFHGDQHCAQGPIGIAAAVAVAEFLTANHLPGSVTVFGTPAEEMFPSAKTTMNEHHVFDGMDVIVRSHSSMPTSRPAPGFGTCCMNIDGVKYTFSGAPAHQLTAWNGRNALTAVIHLFDNIDGDRSNIRPEARIQGVITQGGTAPNVVPDLAQADFYIRYPDEGYLKQVREFVDNAAQAAALATGTKVKIEPYGEARDGISEATLAEPAFALLKLYGASNVLPDPGKPQGFEETGTVSRDIPGVGFYAHTSNATNHTYEMEQDNEKPVGHDGFTIDAQAMAALLEEYATRQDFRTSVTREFNGLKGLLADYLADLQKAYAVPLVKEPK